MEDVFDKGIGDLFVGRVAGNFVNEDLLGSMEFACHVAGAKLIVVMGHEYCGAIKSAIDNVKIGNITSMLSKIRPIVKEAASRFAVRSWLPIQPSSIMSPRNNVRYNVKQITRRSPLLREMVKMAD